MIGVRERGEQIRRFILEQVEKSPGDVTKTTSERFGITRQAVNKHLRRLVAEGVIRRSGKTRDTVYRLAPLSEWFRTYKIESELAEDVVWTRDVRSVFGKLPDNVLDIWHYGFTEMFNNAIDHSSGETITVHIRQTATTTEMLISDDGIGIFRKIQAEMGLLDERHSILELAKGKLTTDPAGHTGEGIFFTSRMFDLFDILSGGIYFSHKFGDVEDWIMERHRPSRGTWVWMNLNNQTARTAKRVFDRYASGDNYGFAKTIVPVRLAQYGNDSLISRSQAKRLLARVELFETVIFDFNEVETIGPAFADEIFRVFPLRYPEISLYSIHANSAVKRMIERARSGS
jgi:DNA-binding transcriptional ArsR family regulator